MGRGVHLEIILRFVKLNSSLEKMRVSVAAKRRNGEPFELAVLVLWIDSGLVGAILVVVAIALPSAFITGLVGLAVVVVLEFVAVSFAMVARMVFVAFARSHLVVAVARPVAVLLGLLVVAVLILGERGGRDN